MSRIFSLLFCVLFSAPLLAQDDAVMLSDQCLFLGRKSFLSPGNYTSLRMGLSNNSISSFHVPKGMGLQVFDGDRFSGRSEIFYSSVGCLSIIWNNRISSLKVFYVNNPGSGSGGEHGGNWGGDSGNDLPPQGDRVIFYRDLKYSGMARAVGQGNFGSGTLGFLSGNVSSIYIPAGLRVKVMDKNGASQTFTSSMATLSSFGWDNRITSGFIETNTGGPGQGGGNGTLPPQGAQVILYRDLKYSGMAKAMNQGVFGSRDLGFLAGNVSSVYIPYGQSIRVNDRNGRMQTFTASISNLAQYGWDNAITAGAISGSTEGGFQGGNGGGQDGNNGQTVRLFTSGNYQGNAVPCGEGRIRYIGITANNQVSSIQLPPGFAITVYEGQNLTGANRTFTTSISNLAPYGWNDRISSVYVFRL